jgi:multidrug efflux system outer membrane protein
MMFSRAFAVLPAMILVSCAVGPDYEKPDIAPQTPAKWKWQSASPRDAQPRGEWWTIFKDSELNRLERMAVANNQQLRASMARVDQARATVGANAAAYAPLLTVDGLAKREQTSGNLPSPVPVTIPASRYNTFSVPLNLSYEIDLWGRIRRSVESANADAGSAEADFHSVLLTLTGDVAANYFLLRSQDAELEALRRLATTREKGIGLIEQRFNAGNTPETDFAKAKSELAITRAELADVKRQREETVSVLALLCGQPASNFSMAERSTIPSAPSIPAGLPASVLERRPDVAAAERIVASRSAKIGVEVAGYFPTVSLTGQGGYLSKEATSLFTSPSQVWSIGPSVSIPVTGIILTTAKVKRARAAHDEAVADYRQSVLGAVKDVETSLTQIRYRREQAVALGEAFTASDKATELTRQLYDRGSVSYLELLDAERTSVTSERQSAQVRAQVLIATVRLIKALGGAW